MTRDDARQRDPPEPEVRHGDARHPVPEAWAEAAAPWIDHLQREWGAQEETVLTLTPNADKSTFLHEIGHLFLWDLEQLGEERTGGREDPGGPGGAPCMVERPRFGPGNLDTKAEELSPGTAGPSDWSGLGTENTGGHPRQGRRGRGEGRAGGDPGVLGRGIEAYLMEGVARTRSWSGYSPSSAPG